MEMMTQQMPGPSPPLPLGEKYREMLWKIAKKRCHMKSEDEEAQVTEWVEANQILWNSKHKEFKLKQKKDRMWQNKSDELGYDADVLQAWYKYLRDWNTKLIKQKFGDPCKAFTEREEWVMARFLFIRGQVRHRRVPVKSVAEALARLKGNIDEAERFAAPDRLNNFDVDADVEEESSTVNTAKSSKRQKNDEVVQIIQTMTKQMDAANADLAAIRQALTSAEPVTERTAFLDWVRAASVDQWFEFQSSFTTMHAKWKAEDHHRWQQPFHFNTRRVKASSPEITENINQ